MKIGVFGLPQEYVNQCINRLGSEIQSLEGKKITILGGTGFFGSWISSILIAGINNGLDLNLNILSRNKPTINNLLDFNNSKVKFQNFDLGNGIPKNLLEVTHIIFSATSSTPFHGNQDINSIQRTSRSFQEVIRSIAASKGVEAVLNLSSGAVYKKSYKINYPIEETDTFENSTVSDYQVAKIKIEKCLIEASNKNPNFKYSSPRLFTFYGPGLPIDAHFAIGNFIRNAFNREAIAVRGHKNTVRSYLHIADASTALIKLLLKPNNQPINLGSTTEISMGDLALKMSKIFSLPNSSHTLANKEFSYYVPSVVNLEKCIGKFDLIDFEKGVMDWMDWLKINA